MLIDGRFRTMVIKGPSSFLQWKSSWKVYRNTMVMLGAAAPAQHDRYEEGIRQLVVAHGPRAWGMLAMAPARGVRSAPARQQLSPRARTVVRHTRGTWRAWGLPGLPHTTLFGIP